jgi:CMP-N,N'-diacetyllegionaminic acid synthase
MRFLAIIPARGGSKGVPRKNIRLVAGRPLVAWTILAAQHSACLDRIVLSTEDQEIASVAQELGVEVLIRPERLASDTTPTRDVLVHHVKEMAAEGYHPEAVITLQPTSPLRQAHHISSAVEVFSNDSIADSLVSCIEIPHIFHPTSAMRLGKDGYLEPYLESSHAPTRRQDKSVVFARNGAAIYITRTALLGTYIFGGRLIPFRMSSEDSLDIDSEEDLLIAGKLLSERIAYPGNH